MRPSGQGMAASDADPSTYLMYVCVQSHGWTRDHADNQLPIQLARRAPALFPTRYHPTVLRRCRGLRREIRRRPWQHAHSLRRFIAQSVQHATAPPERIVCPMKLRAGLVLVGAAHVGGSATLRARSAPFEAVAGLTSLSHDHSRQETVQRPDKYFHEATFDAHYDGRFAEKGLPLAARAYHLRLLVKSYVETMDRIGVRTWIMHGCLLGWFWNGRIMPWDHDVDFMVEERGMRELGGWWNMTVHPFTGKDLGLLEKPPEDDKEGAVAGMDREALLAAEAAKMNSNVLKDTVMEQGKKYLLEVNPHYANTSTRDRYNVIDARWIDTSTGLYIDITAVHNVPTTPSSPETPSEEDGADDDDDGEEDDATPDTQLYTKDQHAYSYTQLFPLRSTSFEDMAVKIPYDYISLLIEEYGDEALTHTRYRPHDAATGYEFSAARKEWVVTPDSSHEHENGGWRGRARKGSSASGRKGGRRKEKTVDDILAGREGEWEEAG